jgi:hypothetical protein
MSAPLNNTAVITRQWRLYKTVMRVSSLAWIGFVAFVTFRSPPVYALTCGVALFFFIRYDLWRYAIMQTAERLMAEREIVLTPKPEVWWSRMRSLLLLGCCIALYVIN